MYRPLAIRHNPDVVQILTLGAVVVGGMFLISKIASGGLALPFGLGQPAPSVQYGGQSITSINGVPVNPNMTQDQIASALATSDRNFSTTFSTSTAGDTRGGIGGFLNNVAFFFGGLANGEPAPGPTYGPVVG